MDLGAELASTLAELQRQAESMMTATCTVSRISTVKDADGYDVEVETLVYSGRCKVKTYAPEEDESVSAGSPTNSSRYVVSFPAGTDVRDGDIVRVDGRRLPLYLRGSHDVTYQTAVRMQAMEVSNA